MTTAAAAKITTNQEYADLVPPLSAEEYESLKGSIKQGGLWYPIVVNSQNVILDGHHRFKACQELGIKEPKTVTKDFSDKLHEQIFVIDSNLQRRHLNNFQRTELALKSKSILEQIAKNNMSLGGKGLHVKKGVRFLSPLVGRVDEQIAKKAGVSRDTVRKVETIQKAVEQKPNLKYIVERARRGEMSVNEAEKEIEFDEDYDAEEKEKGKWRMLREEVLNADSHKCRECGDNLHLDVHTITPYHDKDKLENLETLCKDCHELKMEFHEQFALVKSLTSIFQHLTGMSGKRWFQYETIGSLGYRALRNKEKATTNTTAATADDLYTENYIEEMEKNPYAKLKGAPIDELVSNTKQYRKFLIEKDKSLMGDREIYDTQKVLRDLIPILKDYSGMIEKEAEARREKDELSKA